MNDDKSIERLPQSLREKVAVILKSPLAQKVLNDYEAQHLKQRREFVARLKKIPADFGNRKEQAGKNVQAAMRAHEEAEAHLRQTATELHDARMVAYAADIGETQARDHVERELRAGADPRIEHFVYYVNAADEAIRHKISYWSGEQPWTFASGRRHFTMASDVEEVGKTREHLKAVITTATGMQLEALTRAQITQRLQTLADEIAPLLRKFELNPPIITDEAVKPPMRWGGRSAFDVRPGSENGAEKALDGGAGDA